MRYQEPYRPQFHFTAESGWINDPNGLVYVDGVYHLFFQHNQQEWGHAISADLLHWEQLPIAISPWNGHQAYSGSAVLDIHNTSGLGSTANPVLVAMYTSWGEGQCLAYSHDNGMTFKRYAGNPVLCLPGDDLRSWPLSARDPLIQWDHNRKQWLMCLYVNPGQCSEKVGAGVSFFTSPNLKQWTMQSHVDGFYVCPDFVELRIENERNKTQWVLMDWEQYTPIIFRDDSFLGTQPARPLDAGDMSANQTWKDLPDGRVIQISWLRHGKYPGMPFDQQLSFPVELSLRRMAGELILCKNPIKEICLLYDKELSLDGVILNPGEITEINVQNKILDVSIVFSLIEKAAMVMNILGEAIYVSGSTVRYRDRMALVPGNVLVTDLRILIDRTSIEIFANKGSLSLSFCLNEPFRAGLFTLSAEGVAVLCSRLRARVLSSIWS